jgi:hypothetical protein
MMFPKLESTHARPGSRPIGDGRFGKAVPTLLPAMCLCYSTSMWIGVDTDAID